MQSKGGLARKAALSPEERSSIASSAAKARWGRAKVMSNTKEEIIITIGLPVSVNAFCKLLDALIDVHGPGLLIRNTEDGKVIEIFKPAKKTP